VPDIFAFPPSPDGFSVIGITRIDNFCIAISAKWTNHMFNKFLIFILKLHPDEMPHIGNFAGQNYFTG